MNNKVTDVSKLNEKQKVNYVKNTLFNKEIDEAVDILLKNEKKDLNISKIIISVLNDNLIIDRIKSQCNLKEEKNSKLFVYSKMLAIFSFYNKPMILGAFLKLFNKDELKEIAIYEYQNRTDVSLNNNTFIKYCQKYKKEAMEDLMIDEEEEETLKKASTSYNSFAKDRKKKLIILVLIGILLILICLMFGYKINEYNNLLKEYKGLIYPGIYLNDTDLSGKKVTDLSSIIEEQNNKILNGKITITNVNGKYSYSYTDLGLKISDNNLEEKIKKYNNGLSYINKIRYIKNNKRNKNFYTDINITNEDLNDFILKLKSDINTDPKDDGMVIDSDYSVHYDKGSSGFSLNEDGTKKVILKSLENIKDELEIEAKGEVVKNEIKYASLESINTKVSSYTTYFVNAGNRGHNINLAASRLNDTIIMPGDVFSYLKVAGPYGSSNGYLPAPVYLNSEVKTENGGGVCQLASTLYNATLRAGLETVSRRGHTFAPTYVPKGLDATVYGTTTDFKVKNNYEYPIYIVSYSKGNYLTVDIWTNENALGGLAYEPYSVASNGGYLAYLKTIKDGQVIDTKYLDRSVYKVHP